VRLMPDRNVNYNPEICKDHRYSRATPGSKYATFTQRRIGQAAAGAENSRPPSDHVDQEHSPGRGQPKQTELRLWKGHAHAQMGYGKDEGHEPDDDGWHEKI